MKQHVWVIGAAAGLFGAVVGYMIPRSFITDWIYRQILPSGWAWMLFISTFGFITVLVPYFVAAAAGMVAGTALAAGKTMLVLLSAGIILHSSGMFAISYVFWATREYLVLREYQYRELAEILKPSLILSISGLALIALYFSLAGWPP